MTASTLTPADGCVTDETGDSLPTPRVIAHTAGSGSRRRRPRALHSSHLSLGGGVDHYMHACFLTGMLRRRAASLFGFD